MIMVKAEIKDDRASWIEEFEVESIETAEQEIKKIIANFNATLRSYERPREFVRLIVEYDSSLLKEYCKKVLRMFAREVNNAYGNMKVKENYSRWRKVINNFLSLKRPNRCSYQKLLDVIWEFPSEFRDERAIEYIEGKAKS